MMTIPVMQFPEVQVPQNPNPLVAGLQTGLQVYTGLMQALSMPAKNKQEQLASQAKLGLTQAQTDLVNAQIAKLNSPSEEKYQSSIGKTFADLEKIKNAYGSESDEYKSAKNQVDAQMQQAKSKGDYYKAQTAYMPMRYAPPLVKEQIIAGREAAGQSPEQAIQQQAIQQNDTNLQNGGMMQPSNSAQLFDQTLSSQPNISYYDQIQSHIAKTITSPDIQKRIYAGARADMTLENIDQFVDQGALNYSGFIGKFNLVKDEVIAALTGKTSPQLMAYQNMQGQLNVLKDEYATALSVPADQISRGELGTLFDIDKYSTNPDAAKQQLKNVRNLLYKTEKINISSLYDVAHKNRLIANQYEDKNSNQYEDKNSKNALNPLQVNAEDLKKLPAKDAKKIGIQNIGQAEEKDNLPTFNNKEEFQAWYKKQSPAMQAEIRRKLGKK